MADTWDTGYKSFDSHAQLVYLVRARRIFHKWVIPDELLTERPDHWCGREVWKAMHGLFSKALARFHLSEHRLWIQCGRGPWGQTAIPEESRPGWARGAASPVSQPQVKTELEKGVEAG